MGTTATSGLSNDPSTWVSGVVPTTTTALVIAHPGTNTFSSTPYLTTGALAINATSIPVSGGSGSIVAGECIQLEHQTGTDSDGYPVWHTTYYRVATGITGNGTIVIDAPGLQIAIPAGTRVLNCGHVVTLSANHTWGNDTAGGFVVNGTIRWPADASRTLTVRANYVVNAGGTEDRGEPGRAIPSTVEAGLRLNDSASLAVGKYSATYSNGARCRQFGAAKTRRTRTTAAITAGATSIEVADATGWQVGDRLAIAGTNANTNNPTSVVLTIAAGYTSGALTVPLSGAVTWARQTGAYIANLTSNVWTRPSNASFGPGQVSYSEGASGRFLDKRLTNAEFWFGTTNATFATSIQDGITSGRIRQQFWRGVALSGQAAALLLTAGGNVAMRDFVVAALSTGAAEGTQFDFADVYCISGNVSAMQSQGNNSLRQFQSLRNAVVVNRGVFGAANTFAAPLNGTIENVTVVSLGEFTSHPSITAPGSVVSGVNFDPFDQTLNSGMLIDNDRTGKTVAVNTYFGNNAVVANHGSMQSGVFESWLGSYKTLGTNITEGWANAGYYRAVSDVKKNGTTALRITNRLTVQGVVTPFTRSQVVPIPANSTRLLLVNLRRTASGTMPVVSVSGAGIATVTSSVPNSADTWQQASLSVVNPTSAVVQATITITAAGALNTDSFVDGLVDYPFIQAVRWYGYAFDEANIFRVVDPTITLTEAEATAALSGITIDHAAQTIIVTAPRTAAEVYCACMLDLVQNLDASGNYRTRHITSPDGVTFRTTYFVIPFAPITGRYTDASGTIVPLTISNIVPGSRVLIQHLSDGFVVLNDIAASSTVSLSGVVAAPIPIRVTVRKGTSAPFFQEWTTTGSIDPVGGFAAVANQQPD